MVIELLIKGCVGIGGYYVSYEKFLKRTWMFKKEGG
jgi:hypothetical protein